MTDDDLKEFMIDSDLEEMQELVKISDDIFDVIRLSENQRSDMLAWCLNPNEGHAQGDAVIKDFLIAAHAASFSCTFDNKKFFDKWTPARIRRSNFGAAFISREFEIHLEDTGKKGRLDLFIVDPTNEIIVAIENKAGATLKKQQLDFYCEHVNKGIGNRTVFKEYAFAYVVLDRDLEAYADDDIFELGTRWTFLDYSWLEASAKRARHHVARNNHAAQLLVAYCQNQTDWEKKSQERISELAADVAMRHEHVVKEIREVSKEKISRWTPGMIEAGRGDLLLFYNQNPQLCHTLLEASAIGGIQRGLLQSLPWLNLNHIDKHRTWLAFVSKEVVAFENDDSGEWPIYIRVSRELAKDDESSKFTVTLVLCKSGFRPDCDVEVVRKALVESFPGLSKFSESDRRRIRIGHHLEMATAVQKAAKTADDVNGLLKKITI